MPVVIKLFDVLLLFFISDGCAGSHFGDYFGDEMSILNERSAVFCG